MAFAGEERTAGADGEAGRLRGCRAALERRAGMLRAVRAFFDSQGYLEVETPTRVPTPALELHIDAEPAGGAYLRTSPELHMKRLLAAGYERIYQIGPCFRRGERGRHHHPEFAMLEWYRAGANYRDALAETRALLAAVARAALGEPVVTRHGARIRLDGEWTVLTVREAFRKLAGWDPTLAYDADRFDLDMATRVEPGLPADRPVALIDYPAPAAALARCRAEHPPVAERWELYVGGLELANAFSELTDAAEQRRRFAECARERARLGKEAYAADEEFLRALERGLPDCAGVALGLDRLAMLLSGAETIAEVRLFTE